MIRTLTLLVPAMLPTPSPPLPSAAAISPPELAVGLTAAAEGNGGLAVGNIAGTNIVNILFILGLSAWIKPLPLQLLSLKLDLPVMVMSAAALLWMAPDG